MIRMLYDNVLQYGDLDRTGDLNLVDDLDLETAVLISIFTERRVEPGDEHSDTLTYKGGWWGNAIDGGTDKIGSRMWLLAREKATVSNVNKARVYLEECLKWLLDDGVAKSVVVTTVRGAKPVDLQFTIDIARPGDTTLWTRAWEIQLDAL